jgi:hypothetical protein
LDESVASESTCPKKPAKYVLKNMCLTNASNSHFYNGYIYCGKATDGIGLTCEERKLRKLTQLIPGLLKLIQRLHQNITANNWFSSLKLKEELEQ